MKPELWVLTCAPGHRKYEAVELFDSLETPTNRRVVVTTQPDPIEHFDGNVLYYPQTDINISKWWTLGLDFIASHYHPGDLWDVLIMESDARMTVLDVEHIRWTMRVEGAVLAGADWLELLGFGENHVRRDNSPWEPVGRLPGVGMMAAGEAGIRHDPQMRWWLADDDFEWQSRVSGGTVLVGGTKLEHTGTQGPLTGERLLAWEEDQERFIAKWQGLPSAGGIFAEVLS